MHIWPLRGIAAKLIAALVISSLLSAALLLWVMIRSFDSGLLSYVNKREELIVERLRGRVEDYYARSSNWSSLRRNRRAWEQLLNTEIPADTRRRDLGDKFGPSVGHRPPHREHRHRRRQLPPQDHRPRRPPPTMSGSLHTRVRLIDAGKEWVGGAQYADPQAVEYPLHFDGENIGWLTVDPASKLVGEFELEFRQSQQRWFYAVVGLLLTMSALLAWGIARHFIAPVKSLVRGTAALESGDYGMELTSSRRDEFGELLNAFNRLSRTLQESKSARDRWVADIAHELRTPLTVLQGEIGALQDGTRDINAAALGSLADEVQSLTRLVQDLYELSLSDLGGLSYIFDETPVADFVDGIVESFRSLAEEAGLTVSEKLDLPKDICVFADADRLAQLLNNLFINSVRYTTAPGEIQISASIVGGAVQLVMSDSEPGVETDELPKLFDRLYRVKKSRSRALGAAGLGLSICRNIAHAHSGTIVATNSELGGLAITVTLPIATEAQT